MKRFLALGLAALAAAGFLTASASSDDAGTKVWRVTIENLTPAGPGAPGSQPLSPRIPR